MNSALENIRWLPAGLLVLAIAIGGCRTTRAPSDWLPNVTELAEDPYGAWIEISQADTTRYGELIAVGADTLFILPAAPRGRDSPVAASLEIVPRAHIMRLRIYWFDSDANRYGLVGLAGVLGSLSHGFAFVLSAPFWTIGTAVNASARSREPLVTYPGVPWTSLEPYARFPQGLPQRPLDLHPRK